MCKRVNYAPSFILLSRNTLVVRACKSRISDEKLLEKRAIANLLENLFQNLKASVKNKHTSYQFSTPDMCRLKSLVVPQYCLFYCKYLQLRLKFMNIWFETQATLPCVHCKSKHWWTVSFSLKTCEQTNVSYKRWLLIHVCTCVYVWVLDNISPYTVNLCCQTSVIS